MNNISEKPLEIFRSQENKKSEETFQKCIDNVRENFKKSQKSTGSDHILIPISQNPNINIPLLTVK